MVKRFLSLQARSVESNDLEHAVVHVYAHRAHFNWLEPYKIPEQSEAMGTGFFINTEGYLLIIENNNAFVGLSPVGKIINALFNSLSMRSTGLLTLPIASMQMATMLLIMAVSFIGAAPASTGSGIKITNFIIILAIIKTVVTGNQSVNIKGRRIPKDQVLKAVTIFVLSLCWMLSTIFCLLITQTNADFLDVVIETISATTNLGLTTGLTPTLVTSSKLFIIMSMIIGRIGSLSLILAFLKPGQNTIDRISYPEERVMLS